MGPTYKAKVEAKLIDLVYFVALRYPGVSILKIDLGIKKDIVTLGNLVS